MSKHTPGPWFAKADPNSSSRDDWVIGIEGGTIDEVAVCSKRDAALIAASPDLLAALRSIVNLWDHHASAHGDGTIFPLHVAARAAIAKAEGKA
jgi:hypothetical protein